VTADPRRWLTASNTRLVVDHMTSIRIAIAAALLVTVGLAGGTGHASVSQAPAPASPAALAGAPIHVTSPILCC
jgi:hypothetical protein